MKKITQIISSIKAALVVAVSCAMAFSAAAQDVPLRVIVSSDAGAIAYLPRGGFDFDGLRYRLGDTLNVPISTSIIGSRIVVTLLLPVDRPTADRRNVWGGFSPILAPGSYTIEIVERGVTVPERRSAPVSFTVASPIEVPVPAFSVFDRKIKKFFLTAKASDVTALVAGNNAITGPEWMPVEDNIRVWATAQPFTVPVCRFYVPAAAVHFFSADEYNDCRKLRALAGFSDEGTAFHVIPPYREPDLSDFGAPPGKFLNICPTGTDPVYRMFDDKPGHPAHRYTTSPDVVDGFVSSYVPGNQSAYRLEGVAFCSPRE